MKSRDVLRGLVWVVVAVAAAVAPFAVGEGAEGHPHGDMELPCSDCHTAEGWRPLKDPIAFDHAASGFPLLLSHEDVDCASCHTSLDFSRVGTACADCHEDPHRGELGFGCEDCHAPAGWDSRRRVFDVHSGTLFPLTGVHASLDCASCHRESPPFEYAATPVECFGCHAEDYRNTRELDHERIGFPTDCELCHVPIAWEMARFSGGFGFEHDTFFQLTGAHRGLDCSACHSQGFAGTPTDCFACHRADYEGTRDPDHQAAGFPTDCEVCHGTNSWEGADFDHDLVFRLTGAHRGLDCEDCHAQGFTGTPTECYGCHRSDYEETDDPDHQAAGFPTACEECHGTTTWEGAVLDHDSIFRLTGAHRGLDCVSCHAEGFAGTPRECVGCHRADYQGTQDPDHQAAGFPTECEVCHTTRTWEGAEFDHDLVFRLTGAHRPLDCEDCHADGFSGTPRECYGCHQADYNGTNDPDHQASGFPFECELCHNTNNWDGAQFTEHDALYFPIYSGRHQGEWDACTDCHVQPSNFGRFECIFCHAHTQEEMDEEHEDVSGYVYESMACYNCHPTGEE